MCGILGVFNYTNEHLVNFDEALKLLNHRGPDNLGIYSNNKVLLGHTRLSIIDLNSSSNQPMSSFDSRYTIVFNGEIYNYIYLKNKYLSEYILKTNSDTEVLLYLFIKFGQKIIPELNGIFSFAIWDSSLESLFIIRDRLGIKPLYYYFNNKTLIFSSEFKSIVKFLPDNSINNQALISHLNFLWNSNDSTLFNGICKLSPGSMITISDNSFSIHHWYKLNSSISLLDKNSKFTLVNLLRKSVHSQMISDVPVGGFLSGGLDSTSIIKFASEINPNIECFTMDIQGMNNEGFESDLPYARSAAKLFNLNLNVIKISADDLINNFSRIIYSLDEPLADPAAFNTFFICGLAKKMGIKVLLSGVGGDDLFTGYRRHRAIYYDNFFKNFPSIIKKKLDSNSFPINILKILPRRVKKYLSGISLDDDSRLINYFRWNDHNFICSLFSKDYIATLNDNYRFFPQEFENSSLIKKALLIEQRFFLTEHNLLYTDRMSMAHGVEVRVPFLSNELVEFSSKIHPSLMQNLFNDKLILKKAMEPYLPSKLIYRSKTGFGVPLRNWLKNDMRDFVRSELDPKVISSRGIFNADKVVKLIDDNEKNIIDGTYLIFSLLCIENWFKKFK